MILGTAAQAQTAAWLQIEAQPTLREAEVRARAYSGAFANVAGFSLSSGWYAIAIGPFTEEEAIAKLAELKDQRLIPADSYIAFSGAYRQQFWPVGQDALSQPAPEGQTEVVAIPAPETPAVEAPVDETPAEARRSEAELSREEREQLQTALQWYGHYASAIDGAFGPGTRNSMADWQAEAGYEPTGILTSKQRAELMGRYTKALAELGLEDIREEESGIEIVLPLAMVEFDRYAPPFAHFKDKNGSGVQVMLISQPGDQAALFGLYDLMQTFEVIPLDGERSRNNRSFTITGRNGDRAAFVYAQLSQGLIKGYALIWNPADEERMARVLKAMQSSFNPFGDRALDASLAVLSEDQRSDLVAGLDVRHPDMSRSGFYIDAEGTVLTTSEVVQQCNRITIGDDQEATVALTDDGLGLAVLRPTAALSPISYARFQAGAPRLQSEIAVSGFSYETLLDEPTLTFGALTDLRGLSGEENLRRLSVPVLAGDAGGPVFDGSGAVLGMLLPRRQDGARVLPDDVNFAANTSAIEAALGQGGMALSLTDTGGAMAPEDLTLLAADMTVLVSCWN